MQDSQTSSVKFQICKYSHRDFLDKFVYKLQHLPHSEHIRPTKKRSSERFLMF